MLFATYHRVDRGPMFWESPGTLEAPIRPIGAASVSFWGFCSLGNLLYLMIIYVSFDYQTYYSFDSCSPLGSPEEGLLLI